MRKITMSFDRSLARCSCCGVRLAEVRRMVAGSGAAYICDACLQLCNEILQDTAPFSAKALELASRPPVVIAAPQELQLGTVALPREPLRSVNIELEQKLQGIVLMLHQLQFYEKHFELHYLWIRPPFTVGFAFVPRIIFLIKDNTGKEWTGDRGGMLLSRPEQRDDANQLVNQGSTRFSPLPSVDSHMVTVPAGDRLA